MKTHLLNYRWLVLWLFIGSLVSCQKALDMAPDGKLSLDEIFLDHDRVGAFLNSCYNNIPGKGYRYYFSSRGPVVWSDDAWDTDAEAEPGLISGRLYNGNASAGDHPVESPVVVEMGNGNYWASYWAAIRNCSVFIQRIGDADVNSETDRKRWKAEAHLLRAYYYHELLKWYGSVLPIVREPFEFDADFSIIEKPTYYEIVRFIIEDCNVALGTDELPWRITTAGEAYRLTKAVAETIKSKMILFAASPQNNDGQDLWQEAYEINKQSVANLKANGYALYDRVNFPQTYLSDIAYVSPDNNEKAALYNEYFTQNMQFSSTPTDKETIYQARNHQADIWMTDGVGAQNGFKSGTNPSQDLVDAYETIDGEPILDLNQPYLDEKHLQPNYNKSNTIYDPQDPYANRDPRFYGSIYYNGSKRHAFWNFAELPSSPENYPAPAGARTRIIATYVGEPQTGIHSSDRKATRTGYYIRKFLHPNSGTANEVMGPHHKLFRLAEVILNFAEAAAEAGHLAEARDAVNEIRRRVDMPDLPSELTQEALILRIRNERRVELAFEENRYFDVRRWLSPGEDLSATDKWITAAEITRNPDGSYSYGRKVVREVERRNYTHRFIWLPVPLEEANRLRTITGEDWQNPGW